MRLTFYDKYIRITCKEATFLLSKRQEAELTLKARLKLCFHLSICTPCTRFAKQIKLIDQAFSHFFGQIYTTQTQYFSEEKKKKLEKLIAEQL